MVRAIKILILCLLTVSGFAQVVQERNARGADRIIILKDGFRVPIRDTATAPALLNYSGDSSRGGVVYDSTLQKLCFWTGVRWVCLDDEGGGIGVDTIYRKAGQDSIFYTINGGAERAIKDSVGGGGGIDSSLIAVRFITSDKSYVGINAGIGGNGTDGGPNDGFNIFMGRDAGRNNTGNFGKNIVAIGDSALANYNGINSANGIGDIALGNKALRFFKGYSAGSSPGILGSIAIGQNALYNLDSAGAGNIAIGRDALFNSRNNARNIAIGIRAGRGLLTGNNIAIGEDALQLDSTGAGNIAIGRQSQASRLGGNDNVSLGNESLIANVGGSRNISIGYRSLQNPTAGNDNVAIGNQALQNATNISNTVAIGSSAGSGVQTGSGVFIRGNGGNFTNQISIGATTAGNSSIQIGFSQGGLGAESVSIGFSNGSGSGVRNTFLGALIGFNRTITGGDNVWIGQSAGLNNPSGTISGNFNILLGAGTRLISSTLDNQLIIGRQSVNWITRFPGTTGQYLFNTTNAAATTVTPSAALEINGTTGAVLLPRLTTAQRDALTATDGMQIYNTTTNKFQGRAGGAWVDLH